VVEVQRPCVVVEWKRNEEKGTSNVVKRKKRR